MKKHFFLIMMASIACTDTYSQIKRHQPISYWNRVQEGMLNLFSSFSAKKTKPTKKLAMNSSDQNNFVANRGIAKKDGTIFVPIWNRMRSGTSHICEYIKTPDGQRNILLAGILLGVGKVIHGQQHQLGTIASYNESMHKKISALESDVIQKIKEVENALSAINPHINAEMQTLNTQFQKDLNALKNNPQLKTQDIEAIIRKQLIEFKNRLDALSANVGKHNVSFDAVQKEMREYNNQSAALIEEVKKQIELSRVQHDAINKLWLACEETMNEMREKNGLHTSF